MSAEKSRNSYKVQTLGDSGVGKSALIIRLYEDTFYENTVPTIGLDVKTITVTSDNQNHTIALWDTAGQEQFRTLSSVYYRGAHGIMLVYDVTNRQSFNNLTTWMKEIETHKPDDNIKIILIGNKIERPDREVSREEGLDVARRHDMMFIETSAKDATGVDQAMHELVEKMVETRRQVEERKARARQQSVQNVASNISEEGSQSIELRMQDQDQEPTSCCF